MENINWLSIVIAMLIPMIVGFIWYHKAVFEKAWMDSIGMTEENVQKANMPVVFGISLVMAFLIAFFFVNFNNGPGQEGQYDTFKHGAFHGILVTIILVMPVIVTTALFEQKSWKNILINVGYWVLTLALVGGTMDAMNHRG